MVRVAIGLLLLMLVPSVAQAKRLALVVGINKYDNLPRERQLVKAVNDARAMEAALKSVGFDVIKAEDVVWGGARSARLSQLFRSCCGQALIRWGSTKRATGDVGMRCRALGD